LKKVLNGFASEHPDFLSYLSGEQFSSLSTDESELLLFIILVIYQLSGETVDQGLFDEFLEKEENNWQIFEDNQKKSWEDKMSMIFESYPQTDLLAFVEDMLVDDEEEEITISLIGREFILVTAKSFIDCIN